MRRTLAQVTLTVLVGLATARSQAEDLSRWVWVAQAPESRRASEPIPTPPQIPLDCPTLEQLGYRTRTLGELSLNIAIEDQRLPADCSTNVFRTIGPSHDSRNWLPTEFTWEASDLFSQPAYFDDPVLERYGQTRLPLVQPWLSGAHFFGQFPLMPYKILIEHPYDRIYTLGYHRPGSPMPCVARRLPRP